MTLGEEILEHLVKLAQTPGFKAYAWHAAKDYERMSSREFGGMQEKLKQRMQDMRKEQQ